MGTRAMATSSKFDPSSSSPDRPLYPGQRGSHIAASLDRSGSFRESMENPILSSLPNMLRSSSPATHGDVENFFNYVHFDPKLLTLEHKSNRQVEYKRHVNAALGISPDESPSSSSKGKLLPSPVPEDMKRLKDVLGANAMRARERVKMFSEALSVFHEVFPTITLKKRSRAESFSNDRSNAMSSDRPVLGSGMGKGGVQGHSVTGGFELEQQKSEERTKNVVPNKRTRTSMVDVRMDVRTNSLVRPSGTVDRDKEKSRITNNGVVQSEERTLPIVGDGWEKSKMKKKRSCIKLDGSPSTTLTKPVNTFQETKQGMQQRLVTDSRSKLSNDSHSFRPGVSNGTVGAGKSDGISQQTGLGIRASTPRNNQDNNSPVNDRRGRPVGSDKERVNFRAVNKATARDEFNSASPTTSAKMNTAVRAPRSGSGVAPKLSPVVHRAAVPNDWELSHCATKPPAAGNNRKRVASARSSSPPVVPWQRPQKSSRTARRTNFMSIVSNNDEAPALDTASDVAGNDLGLGFSRRLAGSSSQQIKLKADPSTSAALSESEESGVADTKPKEKGRKPEEIDQKSGQNVQKVSNLVLPTRKNKLVSEEHGDGVRRQGRTGRSLTATRSLMPMTSEKLGNIGTAKQLRSARLGSDKNESKAGRPPSRKLSDRKAYARQKPAINAAADFFVGSEDGHEELLSNLIASVCKCHDFGDEAMELLLLKTLLSAVTSISLRIHGDSLLLIVRTCYDIYLVSKNVVNQTTAKASLIQMLVIVFRRMEADSSTVPIQPIVVAELMEPVEKSDGDNSMTQFVQGFITKIMQDIDGVLNPTTPSGKVNLLGGHDGAFETTTVETTNPTDLLDSTDKDMLDAKYWEISMYKTALEGRKGELVDGEVVERDDDLEVQIGNKLRRDAFLVFRALCKLSMKTPPKEVVGDPQLMKGKIVALELLKILLENAGAVFRTSERFLGAIKQYLCLSLLKNSASTLLIVFQLSCSIFISLVSRFRVGLKAEIGVFFPMIVLRVLENVSQHNFQQKMIVLRFLEKLCVDSQILVDIFINYDCDVNSSNIFERMVNGLLKTAQGVPPGVTTTLLPPQEATLKLEAMKSLVAVLKSMGNWMNKQLRIPDPRSAKKVEALDNSPESGGFTMVNGNGEDPPDGSDTQSEVSNDASDVSNIEQRRAYKLELQEGISLFNRRPKKGIEFLINANKVGDSPEDIAAFLKEASGLNKTLIGDYLGEREELPLKVMHAYVDSFNFQGMEFDEAIRVFLQGFRLPGEAQKIDRIMEKFAERYCKCNSKAFSSADTAYVLAYSVIMLNTDAHNPMVKNKMSPDDFIRNNRGIDDGKDLPEEYLKSLFDRISRNEIKMKENDAAPLQKQAVNPNRLLGLDSILNIVIPKRGEENMETSDDLIRHMQEQFKEKARRSESIYYAATDVVILRFMIEVCWAPMLAAFSVPLDQSDDEVVISLCLEGFRHAIHVTSVMSMKTHRDAFVTSLAKFTSLHSPADIKQKNVDAIKAIVVIADEDGNYLQEAWEHILTCVSRFEHLHLLGEGAPPDATFFAFPQNDSEKTKQAKSTILPVLKKKGLGRMQYAAASLMRGSYDSTGIGSTGSGVTSEQVNSLVSNLNMLEQVGNSEMSRIFTRSQKLNSEAVIDFVKALCKVSMEELRSPSDPRVFSLTKIVEIAHYNMNRIRLVWSSIWLVLSDFFVTIGCSANLSIAIFAMDSLRQLSMKFLEREELANYNFQNEFMKPFVIVMRKSRAVEIRELIIRCISQMVLSRVNNVKSGWKSMFMVFTTAAYDDHKNIVLLAFEMIEKIIRDYFPCITETETTTFTDCVNCLIAFTNSRFNKEISLNAIAFLRFCTTKLAAGDLGSSSRNKDKELSGKVSPSSLQSRKEGKNENGEAADKDDHLYFWFPLLAGLSELSFDPRPEIRKSALDVLFETLRNHGHLFSLNLWERVFESILFPIFDYVRHAIDPSGSSSPVNEVEADDGEHDSDAWLYETCTLALQLVVDLFVNFYNTVNPLLRKVLLLLVNFINRPHQSLAGIGIAAFVRLMSNAGELFSDEKWLEVVFSLKEAAKATLPNFYFLESEDFTRSHEDTSITDDRDVAESGFPDNLVNLRTRRVYAHLTDAKCRAAVQLLLIQAVTEIYAMYRSHLPAKAMLVLFDALHAIALHAHQINNNTILRSKLQEFGSMSQMQDPPLLRLENESYQICLTFLQNLVVDKPPSYEADEVESHLIQLCQEVLEFYIEVAGFGQKSESSHVREPHWYIPLGSGKSRELASRSPLIVATLHAICSLGDISFEKNLSHFFPLISSLVRCEHGSKEVQVALSDMLTLSVGPVLLQSC